MALIGEFQDELTKLGFELQPSADAASRYRPPRSGSYGRGATALRDPEVLCASGARRPGRARPQRDPGPPAPTSCSPPWFVTPPCSGDVLDEAKVRGLLSAMDETHHSPTAHTAARPRPPHRGELERRFGRAQVLAVGAVWATARRGCRDNPGGSAADNSRSLCTWPGAGTRGARGRGNSMAASRTRARRRAPRTWDPEVERVGSPRGHGPHPAATPAAGLHGPGGALTPDMQHLAGQMFGRDSLSAPAAEEAAEATEGSNPWASRAFIPGRGSDRHLRRPGRSKRDTRRASSCTAPKAAAQNTLDTYKERIKRAAASPRSTSSMNTASRCW